MNSEYLTGQVIKAKARMPFLFHYAIIINWEGQTYVLHNTPVKNAVMELLTDFLKQRTILEIQDTDLMFLSAAEILERFNMVCKKEYSLFYNCEHFIDCMMNQPLHSEQLTQWTFNLSILGFVLLILKLQNR